MEFRDRWLNPPEWVERVDKPVSGISKRRDARNDAAAKELRVRTLIRLYNVHPRWLADAHAALNAAVAAAHGWDGTFPQGEALRKRLALNSME